MKGTHRIAILVTAFAVVLGLAPGTASAADSHQVAVIAHRGSGAMAPENTLASVQLALKQGADYIENDIMRTSDGALVIMHDLTLARTTNVEQVFPDRAPWNTATFTLAEIKQLDAGSWFSASYAGQRVPTLREWVEAVGSRAGMLLEAKDPWAFPGIERDIDKELRSIPTFSKALAANRVIMQAGDEPWLRAYHDLAPDVPVGLLYYTRPTDEQLVAASTWLDSVHPALGNIDEAIVDRSHALGLDIHVWTVNFGGDMSRGIAWGVDGIITDYPSVLRDIIRKG
ncbi:MAG: glycerophosphodiester phosphodiesterase family protein [Pedococcus sp.]